MRRAIVVSLIGIIVASAIPAAGDNRFVRDPRDTKGRLDVRRLEHGHGPASPTGARRVRHIVTMHRGWWKRRLRCGNGPCHGILNLEFSTDRDSDRERLIQVYVRDGRYTARIFAETENCVIQTGPCEQRTEAIGRARVTRPSSRSISVSLPVRKLGQDLDLYRWRIQLAFGRRSPCPEHSGESPNFAGGHVCIDYAPQRSPNTFSWFRHRL